MARKETTNRNSNSNDSSDVLVVDTKSAAKGLEVESEEDAIGVVTTDHRGHSKEPEERRLIEE